MGKFLNMLTDNYEPEMAIIVYMTKENDKYLEKREIKDGMMMEGSPLSEKCLQQIVKAISPEENNIPHGVIPSNMLYADSRTGIEHYIWYNRPEKRKMYFHKDMNIHNGEMIVPGLIYQVKNGILHIYAFKGLNPKDKLYAAPFFNIYADGKICLGNAKVEKSNISSFQNIIDYWEEMFWKSEFTHLLGNPCKTNLSTITRQCIENKTSYPNSELIPIKTTLKNLLK